MQISRREVLFSQHKSLFPKVRRVFGAFTTRITTRFKHMSANSQTADEITISRLAVEKSSALQRFRFAPIPNEAKLSAS
jgi:hypothetical protein